MQVDVTEQLGEIRHQATLIGDPGLRQMMYRTQRSSNTIRFTPGDDTKRLACAATVSDIGSALAIATLLIYRQCQVKAKVLKLNAEGERQ